MFSVISYRNESDFEIERRLYVFKTSVAHRTSGRAVESGMRLGNQEEMSKPTLTEVSGEESVAILL